MSVKVEVIAKNAYNKTQQLMKLPQASKRQLTSWGAKTVRKLKMRGGGGVLKAKTSHLRDNIDMRLLSLKNYYSLTVGTGPEVLRRKVKYADILNRGGTIHAKRKKFLTIPLGKTKGWARNYDNTFIQRSKKGNLLIFQKSGRGKGAKITPLFLLKKSVRIPPKWWFTNTIKKMKPELRRMMGKQELLRVAKRM